MYGALLAMSLSLAGDTADGVAAGGTRDAGAAREKELLEQLAEHRRRLQSEKAVDASRRSDAPSRIAMELEYDRALIRLCQLHAIVYDVARFDRPQLERRRLEDALEAAGVDVRGAQRHGAHHVPARPHEPPVGS